MTLQQYFEELSELINEYLDRWSTTDIFLQKLGQLYSDASRHKLPYTKLSEEQIQMITIDRNK